MCAGLPAEVARDYNGYNKSTKPQGDRRPDFCSVTAAQADGVLNGVLKIVEKPSVKKGEDMKEKEEQEKREWSKPSHTEIEVEETQGGGEVVSADVAEYS